MNDYRVVLPRSWRHIPLRAGTEEAVDRLADEAVEKLPDHVSPDEAAQARIKARTSMLTELAEARDNGAIDFFLPTEMVGGKVLATSFVVAEAIPDAMAGPDSVGPAMAALGADDPSSRPTTIGDVVWLRSDGVQEKVDEETGHTWLARKVQYLTAVPSDSRRWFIVTCTSLGDGDPHSDFTDLMIELFDAIMSTWRWLDSALSGGTDSG